jgi:hypothetical protein
VAGDLSPEDLADARRSLLTPVETKEALRDWIGYFLGVELPDGYVATEGPNPSNCSPMEMAWRVYDACRRNETDKMPRVLAYAARDSFKSLAAAILEVLAVLHLRRPTAHAAAQESQAKNVQKYVKEFFERPFLKELKEGDSIEETSVRWFERRAPEAAPTGPPSEFLFKSEWKLLSPEEQERWTVIHLSITVMPGTVRAMNSFHGPMVVLDEVDLFDPAAYKQSRMMPAPYAGLHPFTLLISTRKSNAGLVQKEVDTAEKSGLSVWHWNIIDVTEGCPPERHLPDEPRVAIYRKDDDLAALSERDYQSLPEEDREGYEKDEGYAGCLKNCKLWVGCRGALAKKEPFDVGVSMLGRNMKALRPIDNTQERFVTNAADSEDFVKAELFCWKPSSEALIYRRYDPKKHLMTAADMWRRISGEERVDPAMTRGELVKKLQARAAASHAGYDWGFLHSFVPTVGYKVGDALYVLFCWSLGQMDDAEKLDFCKRHFGSLDPIGWGDPEAPNTIKTFRKGGFKMRSWEKGKGSVMAGIESVRRLLWQPNQKEPKIYFLKGDPGVEHLALCVSRWEWLRDKAGNVINDEPSETMKDENDSLRYMVMNAMKTGGGVRAAEVDEAEVPSADAPGTPMLQNERYTTKNWGRSVIEDALGGGSAGLGDDDPGPAPASMKKGRLRASF